MHTSTVTLEYIVFFSVSVWTFLNSLFLSVKPLSPQHTQRICSSFLFFFLQVIMIIFCLWDDWASGRAIGQVEEPTFSPKSIKCRDTWAPHSSAWHVVILHAVCIPIYHQTTCIPTSLIVCHLLWFHFCQNPPCINYMRHFFLYKYCFPECTQVITVLQCLPARH